MRRRTGKATSTAAITRNVAASASSANFGSRRSAANAPRDQRPDHEPDRAGRLDEPVRAPDSRDPGEQRDECELRRLRDGDAGAEDEREREDRRAASAAKARAQRSPPGSPPTRSRAPASRRGRRSTPTWPASTASGAQRQMSRTARPRRPGQSSFARSDSAIIATQSPIDETAMAPATMRRSRSRVVGGHPPANLRL